VALLLSGLKAAGLEWVTHPAGLLPCRLPRAPVLVAAHGGGASLGGWSWSPLGAR
jgi:hypothetical protein